MAKVIQDEKSVNIITVPWWSRLEGVRVGFGLGALWVVLMLLVRQFVVEPWACRDLSAVAATCSNSTGVSGNIAAILVAVIGVYILVQRLQARPVVVAVGSLVVLWGLGSLTDGLAWYWVFVAGIVFYAIAYGLFSLVSRVPNLYVSVATAAVVAILTRVLVAI